jgi:hypothetical protein
VHAAGVIRSQRPAQPQGARCSDPEGRRTAVELEAGVVDQFVQSLAESPLFAITPENKDSIVEVRAAQSGSHWGYEYKLIVPLKRPIPL